MAKFNTNDIMEEFKKNQNLLKGVSLKKPKQDITKGYSNKPTNRRKYDPYESYRAKLEGGLLEKFSTRDMTYFFKDVANENGVKYVIANIQKDQRCYKMCLERGYTIENILAMIEFLFTSGQQYLDVQTLQPTILISGWCNVIYSDTMKWLDDEFNPSDRHNNKSKKNNVSNREWKEKVSDEEVAEIGKWDY